MYAAYASNMDPAQMALRCPHSPQRGTGWLEGWRLTFGGADIGWEGAMATLVEDEAERVFVVLYDITEQDARALDSWDGATLGYYRKLKVRVETLDGDVLAITSKVVAIHRGRCVPVTSVQDKEELVEAEADAWHLDRKCWNRCEQLERPFCVLAKRSL